MISYRVTANERYVPVTGLELRARVQNLLAYGAAQHSRGYNYEEWAVGTRNGANGAGLPKGQDKDKHYVLAYSTARTTELLIITSGTALHALLRMV
jgi:hypothetical protein